MDGFALIHRQLLDSWVFADDKALKIWLWCLLKATYKKRAIPLKVGKGIITVTLSRGQFIFGRHKAEEELFINGSAIYRKMQKMQDDSMIVIESNNQYSVITICNYDHYQKIENFIEQPTNRQRTSNEQVTHNRCTTNAQPMHSERTQTKKVNTVKKVNKVKEVKDFSIDFLFYRNDFKEIWENEFIDIKKKKKASTTERTLKSQLKKIEKLSGGNYAKALEILEKSVNSGWTDFYELKEDLIKKTVKPTAIDSSIAEDPDRMKWSN